MGALPVAPAFSHPIPEFVLEQIRFAQEQKRDDSSEEIFRKKRDASDESFENIPILRNELIMEEDGTHNFEVETGNGIVISRSGDSDGDMQGVISFTHPDRTPFRMTFVADENGFQPESDALPVAPAFPHPIPEFVLDQIRFAQEQKRDDSSEEIFRKKRDASDESFENIPILRNELIMEEDGTH